MVGFRALAHDERLEVLLDGDDVTDSDYDSEDSNGNAMYFLNQ